MRIDPGLLLASQREPHAGDLFADREPESVAFKKALAAHRRYIDGDGEPVDERRNVLVYYGVGGVGKTTLSERLESWVHGRLPLINGWGQRPDTRVDVTARIDLHSGGGQFDVVGALLAIRQELGALKNSWPAFDFAFAAYWSSAHPGEPLPVAGPKGSAFSAAVQELIGNVLLDLSSVDAAVGLGLRAVRGAMSELRRRETKRLAFESYDGYRDLVDKCLQWPSPSEPQLELVAELAVLLEAEIGEWTGPSPMIVVFIDTVERLALDSRRTGESLLNQMVWYLPHVLFVVTGRNMLDWCDGRRTNLRYTGPARWPGVVLGSSGKPRQHLVGNLSPEDTRAIILQAREMFGLPISDNVVRELVKSSCGLPQYLDLARSVAMTVKANGGTEVTVEEVTGSLGDLVMRVLEDIPADEQRAIRGASMFSYFDPALIAAAAGVDHGCAERAVRRPMIDRVEGGRYPYRMHDEIRAAIRYVDHRVSGGWSEEDWREAGTRALRHARRLHDEAAASADGPATLSALGLAIGIVCDIDVKIDPPLGTAVYADWLSQAIVYGPSVSSLRPFVPTKSRTAYGRVVLDFILAMSTDLPVNERMRVLREILESGHPLERSAGRWLGYVLRNNSRWDDSISVFDELVERFPADLHRYQRVNTLLAARRFVDVQGRLGELTDLGAASARMKIAFSHGLPNAWIESRGLLAERLRAQSKQREYLEEIAASLRNRVLILGDVEVGEIAGLVEAAEAVGHKTAEKDALASLLLLEPLGANARSEELNRFRALDTITNNGRLGFRTALLDTVSAFVSDDDDALKRIWRAIDAESAPRSRMWIPIECLLDSLGAPLTVQPTQWLEPYEVVRDRWTAIFDAYKERALARRGDLPVPQAVPLKVFR